MQETTIDFMGTGLKLILSLAVVVGALIAYSVIRKVARGKISDKKQMHTVRILARNALLVACGVIVLLVWLGPGNNLTLAMGILGAGIAFASQEVIGSFAGYLDIISGNIYRIGDRVRIGDVVGDVIDISILRTTVMEVGEWVKADQYTGRVVTVANRAVFADPVYNFTQHWGYLWDEVTATVTYESDWQQAAEIMLEHGQTYTEALQAEAEARLDKMADRFPLQHTKVEPAIYLAMSDSWIEITLRYIVDAQERRKVKGQLHRDLLQHFQAEENIAVASTTIEIVGFPRLQVDQRNK
jgi:small-conductance mechanosensitive channel